MEEAGVGVRMSTVGRGGMCRRMGVRNINKRFSTHFLQGARVPRRMNSFDMVNTFLIKFCPSESMSTKMIACAIAHIIVLELHYIPVYRG